VQLAINACIPTRLCTTSEYNMIGWNEYVEDSTYLGEFVLHVSEDEQKAADGVPQSAVSQSQLIAGARTL